MKVKVQYFLVVVIVAFFFFFCFFFVLVCFCLFDCLGGPELLIYFFKYYYK